MCVCMYGYTGHNPIFLTLHIPKLHLSLPSGHFPRDFDAKMVHALLVSPVPTICPIHHSLWFHCCNNLILCLWSKQAMWDRQGM
jgi:hypothetical protein